MTYAEIVQEAASFQLEPLGGFHEDGKTTVLLGPKEPGFWRFVQEHPTFQQAPQDPLDTWSTFAIKQISRILGADAVFPFGGPPHHPFITWALRSGEAWQSPVGLLVHKNAGLLVSYRGALVFDRSIDLPPTSPSPCNDCADQPCKAACPVNALTADGYDVPTCKTHIETDQICREGCRVRMSCPVSQSYGRDHRQTAFHMNAFHPS